jgi:hypothetical protein
MHVCMHVADERDGETDDMPWTPVLIVYTMSIVCARQNTYQAARISSSLGFLRDLEGSPGCHVPVAPLSYRAPCTLLWSD